MTTERPFETDSIDYEILTRAVSLTKGVDGFICEIGVRCGGATKKIIDTLISNNDNRLVIGIDPYGDIEYYGSDKGIHKGNYTNNLKRNFLKNIYELSLSENIEYLFFPMEDTEFFKRFSDGVPIYNNKKSLINSYSLVFVDGQHTTKAVLDTFEFFKDRISKGGIMVFDDCYSYNHEEVHNSLINYNFEIMESSYYKKSYIKK